MSASALTTTNPALTAASILTLFILGNLLWRPGEPPVLLFAAAYQWMQVTTLVFIADFKRVPVTLISISAGVETAIWLGLLGILVLAIGMRFGVRRLQPPAAAAIDRQLASFSVRRVFALYLASALFAAVVPYLTWRLLPIAQLLLELGSLKWAFYILLGYITLKRRTKRVYFIIATLLEFVAGIGFFSGFKTVFFVCALVILSTHIRVNARMLIASLLIVSVVALSGVGWISIREEYRNFLNRGTGQQVVLVSPTEQVTEFADLVTSIEPQDLSGSAEQMFRRLAYVDFFAAVLDYVPSRHPFENGAILLKAVRHLFPRFLDPGKDILESDSEITMRYTGISVASADRGTSIGIGYMAEAYVDFGAYGMFVLVILFGVLWGSMYAWLVSRGGVIATGLALGTTLLIGASQFEIAEAKLLGGMLSEFLVLAVFVRFAMPALHHWLGYTANARARFTVGNADAYHVPDGVPRVDTPTDLVRV
jgi:hypothetical protein